MFFSCSSLGEWHELCLQVLSKCKSQLRLPRHPTPAPGGLVVLQTELCHVISGPISALVVMDSSYTTFQFHWFHTGFFQLPYSAASSIHFRIIMCFFRLISSSFFFKLKSNENQAIVIFNHQKITTSHSQLNENYVHLCRFFSNDTKIYEMTGI